MNLKRTQIPIATTLVVCLANLAVAQVIQQYDGQICPQPRIEVAPAVQCGFNDIGQPNPGEFRVFFGDHGSGCEEVGRELLRCLPA